MTANLIGASVRHRVFVIGAAVALLLGGLYAFRHLNVEAYPDPSSPIVEIIAQNPGWSAEEMERQITIPLETQLNGMPRLATIRSISLFGLSNVKCYFVWGTDYMAARQEALNRLQSVNLPPGVEPRLSPWSALGEIYRYQLTGQGYSAMELKEAQDWILERQFRQVPGIIDVISFGGPTKEFHVDLDPNKLISFGVSISDVIQALKNSNSNVGGNYLRTGEQSYNIRGIGLLRGVEDIADVMVAERGGTPLYVRQLGEVRIGNKVLLGKVGKDGDSDVVQGIVMMHRGQQTLPTLRLVHQKVEEINTGGILPPGMRIAPYYDRTDLIEVTTSTVQHVLLAGMVLVGFIMIAFLGDLRAALIVTMSIPLALLLTFVVLVARGYSANLISMGALDFGIIVDASVIMVENIHRRLSQGRLPSVSASVVESGKDVAAPIFFSMAVIVAAFIPLFTMQGVEGRIFGPLAVTYGIALSAALLLSLTYAPALSSWLLKPRPGHGDTLLVRWLSRAYAPVLSGCLSRPLRTLVFAGLALAIGIATVPFIGGEFMPKLEEGNLWVRAALPNNISFEYASQITEQIRARIKVYPEVTTVVSQLGRPDDGTDAVSWFNTDMFVNLQPRQNWRKGLTKPELVRQMAADLRQIPGVTYNFSQNIQDNVNEAMSGVKGENSIKIFGGDLETLESVGEQIKAIMRSVPGVTDAGVFAMLGQPNLLIRVNRQRAARYGLLAGDVNSVVQAAVGGQAVTQVLDGERRFDLVVRFLPDYRSTAEAIRAIPISTRTGRIPLREVADVVSQPGASFIYREGNARYLPIKFSVRGRDLKSTIADAEERIRRSVDLPPGYRLQWAGEFQQLRDALDRLMIVVPITMFVIFGLLYGYFQDLVDSLIVLGSVPLALLGGVFALLLTGTDLSISATVGFICVLGVVILNGVVLVARVNSLRRDGRTLFESVVTAAQLRLRAVMMVSAAAGIGLLPASVATGIGSETQQPLARVVVGSMVTAPIATLLVLPALSLTIHRWMEARAGRRVPKPLPGQPLAGE